MSGCTAGLTTCWTVGVGSVWSLPSSTEGSTTVVVGLTTCYGEAGTAFTNGPSDVLMAPSMILAGEASSTTTLGAVMAFTVGTVTASGTIAVGAGC